MKELAIPNSVEKEVAGATLWVQVKVPPWTKILTPLCLNFLICKIGIRVTFS
jgi:hypothetical protein